ncbi:MAG: lytic transglycosylase domain-containing protein [Rickettsiales bacterium]
MLYRLPFFLITILLLATQAAQARLPNSAYANAENAFNFAKKRDWDGALLHAEKSNYVPLITLIRWQYLLDSDSGAEFNEITRFISGHPDWPQQKTLRIRAEMSLRDGSVSDNDIIAWFANDTPITGVGKIALAEALARQQMSTRTYVDTLIRGGWIDGDFDSTETKRIRDTYKNLLGRDEHFARVDRLLWEQKTSSAEDMLPFLSKDQQKLAKARIALIRGKKRVTPLINAVPSSLKKDPGLQYDRLRFRAKRGDDEGVREILLGLPEVVPYPKRWWRYREGQVRQALSKGNPELAQRLLATHGLTQGAAYADARWLNGWLQLEFLDRPRDAYELFYGMYEAVNYPVSKARAAYWAGRAAEKSGERSTAHDWYANAAAHPTTFYGQLAALKVYGTAPLRIPAQPGIGSWQQKRFDAKDMPRAAVLAAQFDRDDLAARLMYEMIQNTNDVEEAAMIAALGQKIGQTYLGVRGAKKALQHHNAVLLESGYPTPKTPSESNVERPLILSIARQESEFDPNARSSAGARGLMQLMHRTAREVARKSGLKYSRSKLYDETYNMQLGSNYLGRMIDSYDGSYVMAIASYNAGPGNVRKWTKSFGTPAHDIDNAVNWIEQIPFAETRNYVQRVLENLQVYRHILAEGKTPKLRLGEDLER